MPATRLFSHLMLRQFRERQTAEAWPLVRTRAAATWRSAYASGCEAQPQLHIATLRVTSAGLEGLARLGSFAAAATTEASLDHEDGWFVVELPVESVETAAPIVLGLGPEVEVIAPAALRKAVREMAIAVADRYRPRPW